MIKSKDNIIKIGMSYANHVPADFYWENYLKLNPDIKKFGFDDKFSAIAHYMLYGKKEKREYKIINATVAMNEPQISNILPSKFDYRMYRMMNPDLHIFSTQDELEWHYINHGIHENRQYYCGMTYDQVINLRNNQITDNIVLPSIVLVNHDSSLTGAPLLLRNTANWLADHNFKNIIFVDVVPNELYSLHPDIKKLYHFNDQDILLNILNHTMPIMIYSNSLNPMVNNPKLYQYFLYKTIFHFYECYSDIVRHIKNYDTFQYILNHSKCIGMVAKQIIDDADLMNFDKIRLIPSFIPKDNIDKILNISKIKNTTGNERIKIGMCGSICDRKNPNLFVYLAQHNPQYDFIWIGGEIESNIKNLRYIPTTKNPYEIFSELDYFFLTSLRDPCPVVVLETLLMNKKLILLDRNIKYEHNIEELENVTVIKNHDNNYKIINEKFQNIKLQKTNNLTNKNPNYINKYFADFHIFDIKPKNITSHIILSYHNDDRNELEYYTNIINQRILTDNNIKSITISISDDDNNSRCTETFKNSINHNNIIIYNRKNAGWDIGGLAQSLKNNNFYEDNEYILYFHNKKNPIWRNELHKILYCEDYSKYDTISCEYFFMDCNMDDENRQLFKNHKFMVDAYDKQFKYISGTCFITKYKLLKQFIKSLDYIQSNLTNINTNDILWQTKMHDKKLFESYYNSHKDHPIYPHIDYDAYEICIKKRVKNYFELLKKYGKRGIANYSFEHAIERYIGYLITTNSTIKLI